MKKALPPALVEAASWRLASQLHRRHPDLHLFRGHPGGGQYDLLWLRSEDGVDVRLNRAGTIQIHGRRGGGGVPNWQPVSWAVYVATDGREFLHHLEHALGLDPDAPTPPSTPAVLVHRLVGAIAALNSFSAPIAIEQGFVDTSGYGGGEAAWLREQRGVPSHLLATQQGDLYEQPGYRFWRISSPNMHIVLETSEGWAVDSDGNAENLAERFRTGGRQFLVLLSLALEIAQRRSPARHAD